MCWMADAPLRPGARLRLKHTTRNVRATVEALLARVDVESLDEQPDPAELALNDIGRIRILTAGPVLADRYDDNRATGAFVLIDEQTHDTVAAGMIRNARAGTAAGLDAELAWSDPRAGPRRPLGSRSRRPARRSGSPAPRRASCRPPRRSSGAWSRPAARAYLLDRRLSGEGLSPGRVARLFADSGAVAVVALPAAAAQVRRLAKELHAAAACRSTSSTSPTARTPSDAADRVLDALGGTVSASLMRKLLLIALIGFGAQLVDGALGMAYGRDVDEPPPERRARPRRRLRHRAPGRDRHHRRLRRRALALREHRPADGLDPRRARLRRRLPRRRRAQLAVGRTPPSRHGAACWSCSGCTSCCASPCSAARRRGAAGPEAAAGGSSSRRSGCSRASWTRAGGGGWGPIGTPGAALHRARSSRAAWSARSTPASSPVALGASAGFLVSLGSERIDFAWAGRCSPAGSSRPDRGLPGAHPAAAAARRRASAG